MKATAVADLHAGGRRVFFDIAAERLLADRQIGGRALQVEIGARLAKPYIKMCASYAASMQGNALGVDRRDRSGCLQMRALSRV